MSINALPALFDHVVFGIYDLQTGIDMIKERTGVEPVRGGCHPNAGTCNALFSIGDHKYFEILAPNPEAAVTPKGQLLSNLKNGAIVNWAARTQDIDTVFEIMMRHELETRGIMPGSRQTLEGDVLSWKVLPANIPDVKIFPFFIQWETTNHPAITSPQGCELKSFKVAHEEPLKVNALFDLFELQFPTTKAAEQGYSLILRTPHGEVEFN
ncbi:MAG: VOC family protein [Chryseolinea sp.]